MATKTYPRPAGVSESALLDALFEAGADGAGIGIGDHDAIGLWIEGAPEARLDEIWERATERREGCMSRAERIDFVRGARARREARSERLRSDPDLAASLKRAFDDALKDGTVIIIDEIDEQGWEPGLRTGREGGQD